jgi:hypothetical protein
LVYVLNSLGLLNQNFKYDANKTPLTDNMCPLKN